MLEGYTPIPIEHFGGLITMWPPEMLDASLMTQALNIRFNLASVSQREGITRAFANPNALNQVPYGFTGILDYLSLSGTQAPLLFDIAGNLMVETPAGSGNLKTVVPTAPLVATVGAQMNGAAVYGRAYLGFSDGKTPSGQPGLYDGGTRTFQAITIAAPPAGTTMANAVTPGNIAAGVRWGVVLFQDTAGTITAPSQPFSFNGAGLSTPPPAPQLTTELTGSGSSTLPAGTYYAVLTYKSAAGETVASPEAQIVVPPAPTGDAYMLGVIWPNVAPPGVTDWGVYVSLASGAEKLQSYFAVGSSGVFLSTPITTSGAAPPGTGTGGLELTVSSVPTGPAQVAKRILAFTVAGAGQNGPYFYIGASQTVNGVNETATIINDNVTTTASFNFDDAFLGSQVATNVENQFRCIQLPNEVGVAYSVTTDRLIWWGEGQSIFRVSDTALPGNYYGDTGFFQVNVNDGQRCTNCFEYRNQLFVVKENGLYLVTPTQGDPDSWNIQCVAPTVGTPGARSIAVGRDVAIIVHRTGAYIFDGGSPTWISNELIASAPDKPGLWERINWAYDHLIWVQLDEEQKVVRIGVPLDGATACSHILKVDYKDGWDSSLRFSAISGRYHYAPGRRWSLDEIPAAQAVRVYRPLPLSAVPPDRRLGQSQLLLAAQGAGYVGYVDPSAVTDFGQPFNWALSTGAVSAAEVAKQMRQGMETLGIVQIRASGTGNIAVDALPNASAPVNIANFALTTPTRGDLTGLALVTSEASGLRISNVGPATMDLSALYLFAKPFWAMRPGIG
jgi:hypothetical protein